MIGPEWMLKLFQLVGPEFQNLVGPVMDQGLLMNGVGKKQSSLNLNC